MKGVEVTVDDRVLRGIIQKLERQGKPTAIVADGVEYGIFHELGTSRGISPLHFMRRAVERVRPEFLKGWSLARLTNANAFIRAVAFQVEGYAKMYETRVDTGALRSSIHVVTGAIHRFIVPGGSP